MWKIWSELPLGIAPHGLEANTAFWDWLWIWPNISLRRNEILTMGKKLVNLQGLGLPNMPPNLVNFGLKTAENGWRVFAHPLNLRIGRHCQPYRMNVITDSRETLARVMWWHELTVYNNKMPGGLTLGFAMHLVLHVITHADSSHGDSFFTGVCLSVCLTARYLKTDAVRIIKRDIEMFHHKS